jgi:hypothetical protein
VMILVLVIGAVYVLIRGYELSLTREVVLIVADRVTKLEKDVKDIKKCA